MWTDNQIDAVAAAAAERADGGRFSDPLFSAQEHWKFWRDIVRTALDVADEAPLQKPDVKCLATKWRNFLIIVCISARHMERLGRFLVGACRLRAFPQ